MVKKPFSLRVEPEILSKIDRIAQEEDRTRGAVIRRILRDFFRVGLRGNNSEKEQA